MSRRAQWLVQTRLAVSLSELFCALFQLEVALETDEQLSHTQVRRPLRALALSVSLSFFLFLLFSAFLCEAHSPTYSSTVPSFMCATMSQGAVGSARHWLSEWWYTRTPARHAALNVLTQPAFAFRLQVSTQSPSSFATSKSRGCLMCCCCRARWQRHLLFD